MTKPALVLQHMPWEGPGLIETALRAAGIDVHVRVVYRRAEPYPELPGPREVAAVVVMGGPMGAADDHAYPGLLPERELMARAVGAGVPVLGVCLGHQLLARALGAEITSGVAPEIGFAPVAPTPGAARSALAPLGGTPVLHWHRDRAALPTGAELLASSPACPNQAFRAGSGLGLQFHLEVGAELFARWQATPAMRAEAEAAGVQDLAAQAAAAYPEAEPVYRAVLARWADEVAAAL